MKEQINKAATNFECELMEKLSKLYETLLDGDIYLFENQMNDLGTDLINHDIDFKGR